jgi:Rrf2 family protein
MPITSRSEYGMRAMILLAEQFGEERLSASELAKRGHIPVKYLEQILAELKRAHLVISHAGARGGYRLARPAAEISAGDVIRALDGTMSPMSCVASVQQDPCELEVGCHLRPLWTRLQQAMSEVLDGTSLHQLAYSSCMGKSVSRGEPADTDTSMPKKPYHMYYI